MTDFGKLVRDRIPEIIAAEGRRPVVEVLSPADYRQALHAKLDEEATELATADEDELLDELADVYEVLRSMAEDAGLSVEQVVERAERKALQRGRFEERLFLVRVDAQP